MLQSGLKGFLVRGVRPFGRQRPSKPRWLAVGVAAVVEQNSSYFPIRLWSSLWLRRVTNFIIKREIDGNSVVFIH